MARKNPPPKSKNEKKKATKSKKVDSDSENEIEEVVDEDNNAGDEGDDAQDKEEVSIDLKPSSTLRKIIYANKAIEEIGWGNVEMLMVAHPKTGQKTAFLIDLRESPENKENAFVFEVMTMEEETRSWFVDDSVITDGNIYACTPIDPLFFVLSALMKSTQAKPLADHLCDVVSDDRFAKVLVSRLSASPQMQNISKKIVCDDITAFKYLEENTLTWLTEKTEKMQKFLSEKDLTSSEASVSSNFTKSSSGESKDKNSEEYLKYACEIIGEYIPVELKKQLLLKLGLPLIHEKSVNKRKSEMDLDDVNSKKLKGSEDGPAIVPVEDYGSNSPANPMAQSNKVKTKDKELQKAAKGTQSLFKFFTPKAK